MFNFGMWNVIPQQMTMFIAVGIMLLWASAGFRRGDRGEAMLFGTLAVAVIAGQSVVLALGHRLPDIWDASEYKEMFIAVGLACFAFDVTDRRRRTA